MLAELGDALGPFTRDRFEIAGRLALVVKAELRGKRDGANSGR